MTTAHDYELAALRLARKLAKAIRKGFMSVRREALAGEWWEATDRAAGTRRNLGESAREALQKALDREGIETYPSLKGKKTHPIYRLYHRDSPVAKLWDALTDPSETNDEALKAFIGRKKWGGS